MFLMFTYNVTFFAHLCRRCTSPRRADFASWTCELAARSSGWPVPRQASRRSRQPRNAPAAACATWSRASSSTCMKSKTQSSQLHLRGEYNVGDNEIKLNIKFTFFWWTSLLRRIPSTRHIRAVYRTRAQCQNLNQHVTQKSTWRQSQWRQVIMVIITHRIECSLYEERFASLWVTETRSKNTIYSLLYSVFKLLSMKSF